MATSVHSWRQHATSHTPKPNGRETCPTAPISPGSDVGSHPVNQFFALPGALSPSGGDFIWPRVQYKSVLWDHRCALLLIFVVFFSAMSCPMFFLGSRRNLFSEHSVGTARPSVITSRRRFLSSQRFTLFARSFAISVSRSCELAKILLSTFFNNSFSTFCFPPQNRR